MFAVVVVKDFEDMVVACVFLDVVSWMESSFFQFFWEHMFLPDIIASDPDPKSSWNRYYGCWMVGPSRYGLGLFFLGF